MKKFFKKTLNFLIAGFMGALTVIGIVFAFVLKEEKQKNTETIDNYKTEVDKLDEKIKQDKEELDNISDNIDKLESDILD
jgi:peptidoglycan hydrolase CwlO-like protein